MRTTSITAEERVFLPGLTFLSLFPHSKDNGSHGGYTVPNVSVLAASKRRLKSKAEDNL